MAVRRSQVHSVRVSAGGRGRSRWCGRRPSAAGAVRRPSGSGAPGPRADVRSPVCDPPRLPRIRRVSRIARCRRFTSSSASSCGGPGGVDAGPPQRLVAQQVAEAGDARLVHEHGLDRRPALGADRAQLGQREVERVGAEPVLVGVELDCAEAARVAQEHGAAVGERHAEAVPRGIGLVARVEERVAGGFVVDEHTSAHAEVQAEHSASELDEVEEDELAAPARVRERLTGRARRAPRAE